MTQSKSVSEAGGRGDDNSEISDPQECPHYALTLAHRKHLLPKVVCGYPSVGVFFNAQLTEQ
jgi:hypothetical protein